MIFIKPLLISFFLSIISLVLVVVIPNDIQLRESGPIYSPYREEIDALSLKTQKGLHPSAPEWNRLKELIEKNNQWFEEYQKEYIQNTATNQWEAWKKKSDISAPIIMVIWGISFYFFFTNKTDAKNLLILVFPVALLLVRLMSILEVILISFIVLIIYFWFVIKGIYAIRSS